jgi:hypothetical protein
MKHWIATQRKNRLAVVLLATAFLFGCAILIGEGEIEPQPIEPSLPVDYVQPELGDPSPWVGKSLDELVEALGPPDSIYQARHTFADFDAGIPAFTYVYVREGSLQVDAYVIDEYSKTVIKYYTR